MNLYLMRHANAGLRRENLALDAKRGLIKDGKEQCMLMARVLSAFKVQVDVIVSSPLKRALQTAQFVGTELGYEAKVEISPALGLDADYAAFQQMLARYSNREGVLVVVGDGEHEVDPTSRPHAVDRQGEGLATFCSGSM